MKKTFVTILLLALILFSSAFISTPYKLIAHRGGVVEDKFAENGLEAIEEAIHRNYWMIEVDIRQTKDGVAITHHDSDFKRFYNNTGKVHEMTWDEISKLRSEPGNRPPLLFEELVKSCKGKLRLMLDTKAPHDEAFCQKIEAILKKHNMLNDCYVIGTSESRKYFEGKAKVGAPYQYLKEIASTDKDVRKKFFLFEHGNQLDDEKLKWAAANKITLVPSINKFHYKDQEKMMALARQDIERLKQAGVEEFQIDSEFDQWLRDNN